MHREGDIIHFGAVDASRCPGMGLEPSLPLDDVPDLFKRLSNEQKQARENLDAADDFCDDGGAPDRQHQIGLASRRLHDLKILKGQLGELAPEVTAAHTDKLLRELKIGGLDLTHLHEE